MKFDYKDPEYPTGFEVTPIVSEETIRVIRKDGRHDIIKKELLIDLIKKGEVVALAESQLDEATEAVDKINTIVTANDTYKVAMVENPENKKSAQVLMNKNKNKYITKVKQVGDSDFVETMDINSTKWKFVKFLI